MAVRYRLHSSVFWKTIFIISIIMFNLLTPALGNNPNCVVQGQIYTGLKWYGYLVQKTFKSSEARIRYQISYPVTECCANLLVYYDDQVRQLKEGMTCKEREEILPSNNNQIIPLSNVNGSQGCSIWNETKEPQYVCTGERSFRSGGPRTWYLAVSRCSSTKPLKLEYYFNVTGFYGECEVDPLTKTTIPEVFSYNYDVGIVIGLGVVCGITTILAIVFIVLFFFTYRRKKDKKGGSVTSSQATMTQDIFYVNPSLSDREHSDSQYSHSQSSGSENYYEVIPDRRSYESINTQLALQGHGLRLNATHLKDPRHHHIPAYILEDYPPPPYQPPNGLQNGIHHRQSSAHAVLQSGHYAGNAHTLHAYPGSHSRPSHPQRPLSQHLPHHICPASAVMTSGHAQGQGHVQGQGHALGQGHAQGQGLPPQPQQQQKQQQTVQNIQQSQQQQKSSPQQKSNGTRPSSRTSGSGGSPVHSESPHSHSRTPVPNGNIPNHTDNQQTRISPHTTTPKLSDNGHTNGHTNEGFVRQFIPLSKNTANGGQSIQLMPYGQKQTPGQNRAPVAIKSPNDRPLLPNGNVAKLLHDAYRIQQFETTA